MPASTDVEEERCFLAWNEVGLIVKRLNEGESSIEIEFNDTKRRRLLFTEDYDIVCGSLSEKGAIFGGVQEEENGRNTGYLWSGEVKCRVILYRAFDSWTSRAFWRVELPAGELPDLVACSDTMVFVVTSRGYVRSWSVSGVQLSILHPCDHIVTLVGSRNRLAIVYEDSYPLEGGDARVM